MEKDNEKLKQLIKDEIKKQFNTYLFTTRVITDMPLDDFQVANRKYVTLNGTSANRPTGSVIGQSYFDTTTGKPVWWNGTTFVLATGIAG